MCQLSGLEHNGQLISDFLMKNCAARQRLNRRHQPGLPLNWSYHNELGLLKKGMSRSFLKENKPHLNLNRIGVSTDANQFDANEFGGTGSLACPGRPTGRRRGIQRTLFHRKKKGNKQDTER